MPHVMMMLVPEAWQNDELMPAHKREFYEYHSCLVEPWDGPAALTFTDGKRIGGILDRNGLRPARYTITKDGLVVVASETGVLEFPAENIERKGRLEPGRMFLVDTELGRIIEDEEIKDAICKARPYGKWLREAPYFPGLFELAGDLLENAPEEIKAEWLPQELRRVRANFKHEKLPVGEHLAHFLQRRVAVANQATLGF